MNERIKELWWKARIGYNEQNCDPEVLEKFAELIIRDCMNVCDDLAEEVTYEEDAFTNLVGSGWNDGWASCAVCITEKIATLYNTNHEKFMGYDPKKSFFRS